MLETFHNLNILMKIKQNSELKTEDFHSSLEDCGEDEDLSTPGELEREQVAPSIGHQGQLALVAPHPHHSWACLYLLASTLRCNHPFLSVCISIDYEILEGESL